MEDGCPFTNGNLCRELFPLSAIARFPSAQNNPYANVAYFGEAYLDHLQDYKNTNKNITTRLKLQVSEWKKIFVAHITTKELIQNKAYEEMLNLIHYHGYTS